MEQSMVVKLTVSFFSFKQSRRRGYLGRGGLELPPPPPLVYLNFLNLHSKIIENGSRIPLKIIDIPRTHPPPPPSGKNFCIRACHVHVLVVYSLSLL